MDIGGPERLGALTRRAEGLEGRPVQAGIPGYAVGLQGFSRTDLLLWSG